MINKRTELKCDCCGLTFISEYNHDGSIQHENYTCDWNMEVFVKRFLQANEDEKYELFQNSIMLGEDLCNIKHHTYKVGLQVFECRLLWLKKRGYDEIAQYLENNRKNIVPEYDKINPNTIIKNYLLSKIK